MTERSEHIIYSERYSDNRYEYRHVILPPKLAGCVSRQVLMSEKEWRAIGVQQAVGWEHFAWHAPEPHILLFRKPLTVVVATAVATAVATTDTTDPLTVVIATAVATTDTTDKKEKI